MSGAARCVKFSGGPSDLLAVAQHSGEALAAEVTGDTERRHLSLRTPVRQREGVITIAIKKRKSHMHIDIPSDMCRESKKCESTGIYVSD